MEYRAAALVSGLAGSGSGSTAGASSLTSAGWALASASASAAWARASSSASRASRSAARRALRSAKVSLRAAACGAGPSISASCARAAARSSAEARRCWRVPPSRSPFMASCSGSMTSVCTTSVKPSCACLNCLRARPMVRPMPGSLSGPKIMKPKATMIKSSVSPIPNTLGTSRFVACYASIPSSSVTPSISNTRLTLRCGLTTRRATPSSAARCDAPTNTPMPVESM